MNTVEFETVCPVCQEHLDRATAMNSEEPVMPSPGDVTLCATCVSLLEFDEDLKPHQINIKELEPEVQDIIAVMMVKLQAINAARRYH